MLKVKRNLFVWNKNSALWRSQFPVCFHCIHGSGPTPILLFHLLPCDPSSSPFSLYIESYRSIYRCDSVYLHKHSVNTHTSVHLHSSQRSHIQYPPPTAPGSSSFAIIDFCSLNCGPSSPGHLVPHIYLMSHSSSAFTVCIRWSWGSLHGPICAASDLYAGYRHVRGKVQLCMSNKAAWIVPLHTSLSTRSHPSSPTLVWT